MEEVADSSSSKHPGDSGSPLPFARCYQLEAMEKGLKQNTIVYLETGTGKTLIAIMLLRSYAYLLRNPTPSKSIAVFLVPKVVLVSQQAEAIKKFTDLKVGMYWGEMGVDFWSLDTWMKEILKHEVLVMTPDILLNGLRHSFFKMEMIKLLIFDECHHARGNHPYALIMTEFYHYYVKLGAPQVPRIFGLTASLIKSKGGNSESAYWRSIHELEIQMNSKVYTCASESDISEYIPSSRVKVKTYQELKMLYVHDLTMKLQHLQMEHNAKLSKLDLGTSEAKSTRKKISNIYQTLIYCLEKLGVWMAWKAADLISHHEVEDLIWDRLDLARKESVKDFSCNVFKALSTFVPSGPNWAIGDDIKGDMSRGFLAAKVVCLFESLLGYRHIKDIRCIIFVERIITAMLLQRLLNELLPKYICWKVKYIAGHSSLQSQSRKQQSNIVQEFREGKVNIIVSTSILEEGLDVQSCNLVIRFDPCTTVSSFIQSRGRARMLYSDFLQMVNSEDHHTLSRIDKYLGSADVMRKQSLEHSSLPCKPLWDDDLSSEQVYRVESTGATVTLSSSVCLLHFYCSRLPSDRYLKPQPRFDIDEEMGVCTLYLPKSSPLPSVRVDGGEVGGVQMLKKRACFEACKQLHKIHALTDNLVPDILVEEDQAQECEKTPYCDEHPSYIAAELVNNLHEQAETILYHCYVIELVKRGGGFKYDIEAQDVVLATRSRLDSDIISTHLQLQTERGLLTANLKYAGEINLKERHVTRVRRFQSTLLLVLLHRNVNNLVVEASSKGFGSGRSLVDIDYLLLPSSSKPGIIIDWETATCPELFPSVNAAASNRHTSSCCWSFKGHSRACAVRTGDGAVCPCMIEHSIVYTPYNGRVYCIDGFFENLNADSSLTMRDGTVTTYKKYYEKRHGIKLSFEKELLLRGRHIFQVHNCLLQTKQRKGRGDGKEEEVISSSGRVELPAELCSIVISPISINTVYSFSFVPSIMHRLESLLLAANLKRMHLNHTILDDALIPTAKVLEAMTMKRCHEEFHLESLETFGDSFLKYAVSQQLFKSHPDNHEGLLSIKRQRVISNAALCKLGCARKLPGFIRDQPFDPKTWMFPGCGSQSSLLRQEEEWVSGSSSSSSKNNKVVYYIIGESSKRKIRMKTVADCVEALLGAYVSTAGEMAGLQFLKWLGIEVVDFHNTLPTLIIRRSSSFSINHYHPPPPEKLVNVKKMEALLSYSFRDPSLLVEALTHGSYMLPEIPACYQRLEFVGDAVLDYVITVYLYTKFPGMSPGQLTDMRSASVNNDCYAHCALKAGLHKHILHASPVLHRDIVQSVLNYEQQQQTHNHPPSLQVSFGWQSETSLPKVLGDVIESLAGAIFVDSGYSTQTVFESIKPLLEPMITPELLQLHPIRELNELCQKERYKLVKPLVVSSVSRDHGGVVYSVTVKVEALGRTFECTKVADDKHVAQRIASRDLLVSLKEEAINKKQQQHTSMELDGNVRFLAAQVL